MQHNQASRTAAMTARFRAAHQLMDGGAVFADPYACDILGETPSAITEEASRHPAGALARLFMAARSRIAEDALAEAVARGVRQVVILGAGLDTFALRNPHASLGLQVFEVDHPDTQGWKRERLLESGLGLPPLLQLVSVEFEREDLAERLRLHGFRDDRRAFFTWLGVVPYLTHDAIKTTLGFVAGLPEAELVFDYIEPIANFEPAAQRFFEERSKRVTEMGEPMISLFNPAEMTELLREAGFSDIEDLGPGQIVQRFGGEARPMRAGPHVVLARCGAGAA